MLINLHVKNLALIEEADIDFKEGLNILTGETGAGKSIILGSINIALGKKTSPDIIRQGCDYALTELTFLINDENKLEKLRLLGLTDLDDGYIIISRKITPGRSILRINGETFSINEVKCIASILIDIHGQHDNRLLLEEDSHLKMVDMYGGKAISTVYDEYLKSYHIYTDIKTKINSMNVDEASRNREISLLEYQIQEIDNAGLYPGMDEELEQDFRKMQNFQKIMDDLSVAKKLLYEDETNISDLLSSVIRMVIAASSYDNSISECADNLSTAEDILSDAQKFISDYAESCSFDEQSFKDISNRLDNINSLKLKYGRTIEDILAFRDTQDMRLNEMINFNELYDKLTSQLESAEKKLTDAAVKLSLVRKQEAEKLCRAVSASLKELNFLNTEFTADFQNEKPGTNGADYVRFLISTNVGEPQKPLTKIASGGELSRIMLAFKSVVADKDDTDTLIFDEIDAGISGKTAQMVGNKLKQLSKNHQIICITHLPQIAALADEHFIIEKNVLSNKTTTDIHELNEEESVNELARLLGGTTITEAAVNNAIEMKNLAKQ